MRERKGNKEGMQESKGKGKRIIKKKESVKIIIMVIG